MQWRLKIVLCCVLCVFVYVDGKVCWFSLILSFGSLACSSICPMLLRMCDAYGDCRAIFVSNNLNTHPHSTHTHERRTRIYLFVRCFGSHHNSRSFSSSSQRRRQQQSQSRHSTNSLVRMFVIHLACLFRYRLLQLMRNRQMYLRPTARLAFGLNATQCHHRRGASYSLRLDVHRVSGWAPLFSVTMAIH